MGGEFTNQNGIPLVSKQPSTSSGTIFWACSKLLRSFVPLRSLGKQTASDSDKTLHSGTHGATDTVMLTTLLRLSLGGTRSKPVGILE